MPRGAAGGAAAFALTAWLAADNGGFDATTWNLAVIVVCAAALVVVLVDGGERPTPEAGVFAGALALLTAWTALSYFWSDSPPLALVEAQRVALYFVVACAVVLMRRWLEPRWLCAGVAGAATLVANYLCLTGAVASARYVVCDVFTSEPLSGNQLAVFTDARAIPEERLQLLAKELNFSETAFVYPPEGDGHVKVRIFTTSTEVPFAGHPCLGTAFVMAMPLQLVDVVLETGSGLVPVHLEREGARIVFGRMEQPLPSITEFDSAEDLQAVLGVKARLPIELYDNGIQHVFVLLESEAEVAALRPNFQELEDFGPLGINCCAGEGLRWKNRMFFPGLGGTEDPATGSAAGPLALHLARHGRIAFGDEIEIHQGVEIERHSTLFARVDGSADAVERIEVGGSAVVVARGEFHV